MAASVSERLRTYGRMDLPQPTGLLCRTVSGMDLSTLYAALHTHGACAARTADLQ
jgi:hypothetical protein